MASDGTPTPRKVAEPATEQARLKSTAPIGIFGSEAAPGALVRLPGGDIARVAPGDTVAGGTVVAIGKDRVVLSRLGGELVLEMPRG